MGPSMLATITEYGVPQASYVRALGDLTERARARARAGFPAQQTFIATLGSTDLIEIRLFDHYLHFAEVAGSPEQYFQRSIGAYCPTVRSGAPDGLGRVAGINEVLSSDPARPFLAVAYLRFSRIVKLCLESPDGERNQLLAGTALDALVGDGAPLWSICEHLHGEVPEGKHLQIAPLVGLDAVDVVLVVRGADLAHFAAIKLAVSLLRLGDIWPASAVPRSLELLQGLLGHKSPADVSSRAWDATRLFERCSLVLGNPLSIDPDTGNWLPEGWDDGESPTLATAAEVHALQRVVVGRPMEIDESLTEASHAHPAGSPAPTYVPVVLGRHDFIRQLRRMEKRTVGSIHAITSRVLENGKAVTDGERTATELAVLLRLSDGANSILRRASDKLTDRLDSRLREERRIRERRVKRPGPRHWIQRWLNATRSIGTVYPVTNGTVNAIGSVLSHLGGNLDSFTDVLPFIAEVIRSSESSKVQRMGAAGMRAVVEGAELLESVAQLRGRHDDPLRTPFATLAFENHAGFGVSRAAFTTFVRTFARACGMPEGIAILDSSGGAASFGCTALGVPYVRVSAATLHHPLHYWIFAHEIAHGKLHAQRLRAIHDDGNYEISRVSPQMEATEHETLYTGQQVMSAVLGDDIARSVLPAAGFLAAGIRNALPEIVADAVFWDFLALEDGNDKLPEAFWFVYGPGLVIELQGKYGNNIPVAGIRDLAIRLCLVSSLVQPDPAVPAWDVLCDFIEGWAAKRPATSDTALGLLGAFKRDLPATAETWDRAAQALASALRRDEGRLAVTVEQAMVIAQQLRELVLEDRAEIAPLAALFQQYVVSIRRAWPCARPWLPMSDSHRKPASASRAQTAWFSRRGGVFTAQEDAAGYYLKTARLLMRMAEAGRSSQHRTLSAYLAGRLT